MTAVTMQQIEEVIKDLQSVAEELLIVSHMYGKGEDTYFALARRIGNNVTELLKLFEKPKPKKSKLREFLDKF